jgi:hypothetical protein
VTTLRFTSKRLPQERKAARVKYQKKEYLYYGSDGKISRLEYIHRYRAASRDRKSSPDSIYQGTARNYKKVRNLIIKKESSKYVCTNVYVKYPTAN